MRRLALAAVAAAALLLGCGSDDDGAATTTTETVPPELRDFCDAFGAVIAGPLADGSSVDARDPVLLQGAVDLTRELLAIAAASAPADLQAATESLAEDFGATFAIWERYGYDLVRVDAEATPEERATLDAFLAPPQGPGATDPLAVLEEGYFDRCAAGVTLPEDVLPTTTSP